MSRLSKKVSLERLVPQDHLLRKIDCAVDFTHIYDLVEDLYCADNGRLSVDPVVLFKMVLIQHLYGIPSLRRGEQRTGDHGINDCSGKGTSNIVLRMKPIQSVTGITLYWIR